MAASPARFNELVKLGIVEIASAARLGDTLCVLLHMQIHKTFGHVGVFLCEKVGATMRANAPMRIRALFGLGPSASVFETRPGQGQSEGRDNSR